MSNMDSKLVAAINHMVFENVVVVLSAVLLMLGLAACCALCAWKIVAACSEYRRHPDFFPRSASNAGVKG